MYVLLPGASSVSVLSRPHSVAKVFPLELSCKTEIYQMTTELCCHALESKCLMECERRFKTFLDLDVLKRCFWKLAQIQWDTRTFLVLCELSSPFLFRGLPQSCEANLGSQHHALLIVQKVLVNFTLSMTVKSLCTADLSEDKARDNWGRKVSYTDTFKTYNKRSL